MHHAGRWTTHGSGFNCSDLAPESEISMLPYGSCHLRKVARNTMLTEYVRYAQTGLGLAQIPMICSSLNRRRFMEVFHARNTS